MKRIFTSVVMGCYLLGGVAVSAATFTQGGIKYNIIDETTCEVTTNNNPVYSGELTIPEQATNPGDNKTYTVVALGDKAFFNATVTKVVLPNTITQIKDNCFNGAGKLASLNLPEGLKILGSQAIVGTALKEIKLPSTLTTIGGSCFFNSHLTGLSIPASVTSIGGSIFGNCNEMEYVIVDPDNKNYCSIDNVLYTKDKSTVLGYPGKCCVDVVFPAEVRTMWAHCGYGNKSIKSITFNEGLETIKTGAAAYGAESLETINFSSTIKEISVQAFMQCPKLKELDFPASMASVKMDAFNSCSAINKITCHGMTPPVLDNGVFPGNVYSTAEVYVPEEAYTAYTSDAQWSKFRKIIAVKGEQASDNSATVQALVSGRKLPLSNPVNLAFRVLNEGKNDISSLSAKFTVGEYTTPELTFSNLAVKSGAMGNVLLPVDLTSASLVAQSYNMSIELSKVNGEANANENNKFDFTVEFIKVQELTGAGQATYCHGLDKEPINHLGGKVNHIDAAIHFQDPTLVGAKVVGAKVLGIDPSGIANTMVWSSSKLAAKPDGETMEVAPVAYGDEQYVDVAAAFVNPVTLTAQGTYFGISIDVTDGGISRPISVYEPKNLKGGLAISTNNGNYDVTYNEFGTLGMILYVQIGEQLKGVKVASLNSIAAGVKDQPFDVDYAVQNYTMEPVSELDFTYTVGTETHEGKIAFEEPLPAYMTVPNIVTIPYEAVSTAGLFDGSVNITKVNGQDNKLAEDFANPVSIGLFQTQHRPLMEEYTGTGCGYCPRGSLALNEMSRRHSNFISAAYHNYPGAEDPMRLNAAMPVNINGAPGAMFDRNGLTLDPYWGTQVGSDSLTVEADYLAQASILTPCDLSLKTEWVGPDMNVIKVEPTVTFSFVEKDQKYSIGYLLTIDSLYHPGENNWHQLNYVDVLAYQGNDPLMAVIYSGGGFDHYLYNHVVFDMTAAKGAEPVDFSAIETGKAYNYEKTFDINKNSLVENDWWADADHSKINVIAFVIDKNGVVRNAAKARAGEETTAINTVLSEEIDSPAEYYDLMGRRVQEPAHGIFIRVKGNKATKIVL